MSYENDGPEKLKLTMHLYHHTQQSLAKKNELTREMMDAWKTESMRDQVVRWGGAVVETETRVKTLGRMHLKSLGFTPEKPTEEEQKLVSCVLVYKIRIHSCAHDVRH